MSLPYIPKEGEFFTDKRCPKVEVSLRACKNKNPELVFCGVAQAFSYELNFNAYADDIGFPAQMTYFYFNKCIEEGSIVPR